MPQTAKGVVDTNLSQQFFYTSDRGIVESFSLLDAVYVMETRAGRELTTQRPDVMTPEGLTAVPEIEALVVFLNICEANRKDMGAAVALFNTFGAA